VALERQKRHAAPLAVAFIDLDEFKRINGECGHHGGDEVLTAIGMRLASSMHPVDAVARYGGDEFVVLRESLTSASEGTYLAQQVRRVFTSPFDCPSFSETVTASIGVAVAIEPGCTAEALLRTADHAMYVAKGRGSGDWEVLLANARSRVSA
jgi:diguanylate cyclase (GGDEF)-like protein